MWYHIYNTSSFLCLHGICGACLAVLRKAKTEGNFSDMDNKFNEILNHFAIQLELSSYGNGHINDTYIVHSKPDYILQRINSNVFTNPPAVMENIQGVTEFLRRKIEEAGGDPERETLNLICATDGKPYYQHSDGEYYRMYKFIDHAETIVNVHNTRVRFENFKKAVEDNLAGRKEEVAEEIQFVLDREADCSVIVDALADGSIPLRVTHNDTKLNNVMLDEVTGEGVCVIDLDTVMPGSLLYDYGDALRFGGSSGAEDEKDLSKIWFDVEKFEYFTRGFIEALPSITDKELELLPFSIKLMTFECGSRFLADYLNGDTYFKTHYPTHNLDRCRTQFKLVADIEAKMDELNAIVRKIAGR